LETRKESSSDLRYGLVPFFPRLGPNWVQSFGSKHFSARGSHELLLSVREVARRLGVSTATVYRLCEHGELAHVRVSHAIRIFSRDLHAYIAEIRKRR
jgi:excisionase family DNA binding protein